MTRLEFIEKKRITDPEWYQKYVVNATGAQTEGVDVEEKKEGKPIYADSKHPEIYAWVELNFKLIILICVILITLLKILKHLNK